MTSTQILKDKYGIEVTWENGKVFISSVGQYTNLKREHTGQSCIYEEISRLMRDVEENEQPPEDHRIIIKAKKCILVLYPDEI